MYHHPDSNRNIFSRVPQKTIRVYPEHSNRIVPFKTVILVSTDRYLKNPYLCVAGGRRCVYPHFLTSTVEVLDRS